MQRRLHPTYVRRTAAATFGLVLGGLACLVLGVALRGTALRDLETILNVAFVAAAIVAAMQFFRSRESTACPECGDTLTGERAGPTEEELVFPCRSCDMLWTTDAATPVDERLDDDES